MANITITTGSVSGILGMGLELKGLAGEALGAGNACRVGLNGLVYKSDASTYEGGFTGTAGKADFDGFCLIDRVAGEPVTLLGQGAVLGAYATGMTPGDSLWISATGGILSDAKIATQDEPVAKVISATDILVKR